MFLEFSVDEQSVNSVNYNKVVNLSQNYLKLRFSFDKDSIWCNLTKRVLFTNGKEMFNQEVDNENCVLVPWEVLTENFFIFELYGINNDSVRVTTNTVKVFLENSGYVDCTKESETPTPSVIDEILAKLNNTVEMHVVYEDLTEDTYDVVVK